MNLQFQILLGIFTLQKKIYCGNILFKSITINVYYSPITQHLNNVVIARHVALFIMIDGPNKDCNLNIINSIFTVGHTNNFVFITQYVFPS